MAVYKVLQDIEAEDKLLGPLTLKGFVYAAAAGILAFLNFKVVISGGGPLKWLLFLILLLPMFLFGVLASPLGREQPTEVWLLARIRFYVKARRRLWDQTGISNLVTVTAPKKVDAPRTKNLSEQEVRNRLQTLAVTLDSRGWAIKNLNIPTNESEPTDRLVTPTNITALAASTDIQAADDILDEQNNPTAKNFVNLMADAESHKKRQLAKSLAQVRAQAAKTAKNPPAKAAAKPVQKPAKTEVTPQERAAKLELAQSGSALSVATVAKLANRQGVQVLGPNEVLINLH